MNFYERRDAALRELEESSIKPSQYKSLVGDLLLKFGLKIRPIYYYSFPRNFIVMSLLFSLVCVTLDWIWLERNNPQPLTNIAPTILGSIIFGISIASYVKWQATNNGLSKWENLN